MFHIKINVGIVLTEVVQAISLGCHKEFIDLCAINLKSL